MLEQSQIVGTGFPRPRRAIQEMAPYVPPTADRLGKLRLDFNENTVGCSPRVVAALQRLAAQDLLPAYPEYHRAREIVGKFFGVSAGQMLFTDGTDEAIHLLCSTYVEPGDEVILPWPTYPMYRFYVEVAGGQPRLVPFRPPHLDFPLEEMLSAVTSRTRLILIANPNSPTGGAIGLGEIERLLHRAEGTALLIDEAYFEFYGITALKLLEKYPNLFVSRTFSKAYGLAGLRVGCLFSQADNIASVHKGQSPYSVNSLGVVCVAEAVEDQQYVQNYVREVLAARDDLQAGLTRLGLRHYPTQANFVLVEFGERTAAVCRLLREKGILVRDRSRELPGTIRITVGTKPQVAQLLHALGEVLAAPAGP
jgi:histidinol-phosphate aminotransferase